LLIFLADSKAVAIGVPIPSVMTPGTDLTKAISMNRTAAKRQLTGTIALTIVAGCCLVGATGCQVSLNGQTLPSPYYLEDDVQYFPAGPEFKLSREAAALRAAKAEEKLIRK
jgi:hypothetical protein